MTEHQVVLTANDVFHREEAAVSTPELDALLEQAIAHINAGELKEGRTLLEHVLEQTPENDRAWVWLSGCVEEPMQRRICLEQALIANPTNQAALDGIKVLEGKLVQASRVAPSLLESRLAAIGMGDAPPGAPPSQFSPAPAPEAQIDFSSSPEFFEDEDYEEPGKKPQRRIMLLATVVLVLFLLVCVLVVRFVALPLLGAG